MTANQVAYAAATETERHNMAYEEETNRHNVKIEDLEKQNLQIQRDKVEYENIYNSERNRIQEEYNQKYLDWQRAYGEEKITLEKELNLINQAKVENEKQHAIRVDTINAIEAGTRSELAKETVRHNKALETLESTRVTNEKSIADAKLRFDKYAFENSNLLRWEELTNKINVLSLEERKFEFDQNIKKFYSKVDAVKAGADVVGAAGNLARGMGSIGFNPFTINPVKQAMKLFK